jgi:hypothetical protein
MEGNGSEQREMQTEQWLLREKESEVEGETADGSEDQKVADSLTTYSTGVALKLDPD